MFSEAIQTKQDSHRNIENTLIRLQSMSIQYPIQNQNHLSTSLLVPNDIYDGVLFVKAGVTRKQLFDI